MWYLKEIYVCGYTGRGAVVLSFASPRKAQLFLSNAKQAKESALYLCVKDLQKFTFDDKRDKVSNIITWLSTSNMLVILLPGLVLVIC